MKKFNKEKIGPNLIFNGLILIVFSICLIQLNENNITMVSAQNVNGKIQWGIKRNSSHEQPDVGAKNKQVLENNGGICLGTENEKTVYLTFDSGYEAGYMENILDVLKQNDVKATFFITSHYLNTATDLVARMIDEGHIVGNHIPKTTMSFFFYF